MEPDKTIAIFFDDLTRKAQDRIIAQELESITGETINDIGQKDEDITPYGYDPDPDKQELLQDIHVQVYYGDSLKPHYWLLVWDCWECEFQSVIEEDKQP